MKKLLYPLIISTLLIACHANKNSYLVKVSQNAMDEIGDPIGYMNSRGDTIIPIGTYSFWGADTISDYGVVIGKSGKLLGIDNKGRELFEIFFYDNGPDYLADGLFRIIKNEKIGYANAKGEIIIEPRFDCALPFEEGLAKVSDNCTIEKDGEYSRWISDDWYWINKKGERVKR